MRLPPSLLIGLIGLLATLAGGGARAELLAALPAPSPIAVALGAARPMTAWVEFCGRYAAECAVDPAEPAMLALTPEVWAGLNAVNRRVNRSVRAVSDTDHWGVPDRWDLAEDGAGDCEDFQLLKRHVLVERGLPRRALRMTVVLDEEGEGHAVLMARTDRGDLVLDNKTDVILPWHRTGYTFIKRESQDAVGWVSLGGAAAPVATANR